MWSASWWWKFNDSEDKTRGSTYGFQPVLPIFVDIRETRLVSIRPVNDFRLGVKCDTPARREVFGIRRGADRRMAIRLCAVINMPQDIRLHPIVDSLWGAVVVSRRVVVDLHHNGRGLLSCFCQLFGKHIDVVVRCYGHSIRGHLVRRLSPCGRRRCPRRPGACLVRGGWSIRRGRRCRSCMNGP